MASERYVIIIRVITEFNLKKKEGRKKKRGNGEIVVYWDIYIYIEIGISSRRNQGRFFRSMVDTMRLGSSGARTFSIGSFIISLYVVSMEKKKEREEIEKVQKERKR